MQAARGASLNASGHKRPRSTTRLFVAVVATVWIIDQVTKLVAVDRLEGRPAVNLVPDVLWLNLIHNPGAAFGAGAGYTVVLSGVALAVCVVVIRISSRLRDRAWALGLGLLLGGALGNLTDRFTRDPGVLRGHVVDFIQVTQHFPVFNVADMSLTFAAVIIVWRTWRGVDIDGRHQAEKSSESKTDEHDEDGTR